MALTYFPISIPNGIIYKGYFYTVASPVDIKAGINSPGLILKEKHSGLEVILRRSSSTSEINMFCQGQQQVQISEYQREFISAMQSDFTKGIKEKELENLASELEKLQRIFYEEHNRKHPGKIMSASFRRRSQKIISDSRPEEVLDPRSYVIRPFNKILQTTRRDVSSDEITEAFQDDDFIRDGLGDPEDRAAKNIVNAIQNQLSVLVDRANSYVDSLASENILEYPNLDSDLLDDLCSLYIPDSKGFIYLSWDKKNPVRIMLPQKTVKKYNEKDVITLSTLGGQKRNYVPKYKLTKSEFNLAMRLLLESAAINSVSVQKIKGLSKLQLENVFPLKMTGSRIDFVDLKDDKMSLKAHLGFPSYGIVDIHDPEYVFLMPSGKIVFDLGISPKGPVELSRYSVQTIRGKEYRHFFLSGGSHACGFNPINPLVSSGSGRKYIPFSRFVWENYSLLYSLLTDGQKYDAGYINITTMKNELQNVPITIHSHTFRSRYLRRDEVEEFNNILPKHKKIHIGDGRTR